jgi:Zn-dependent protease with chaperone function
MFAARGIVVAFSVFALAYIVLSLAVCGLWRRLWNYSRKYSTRRRADLLFALRVSPLVLSIGVTLALAVPSFVLLEPRAIDEPMGWVPLVLGFCGLVVVLWGVLNVTTALVRARRAVASWAGQADVKEHVAAVPVLRISRAVPALTAAGVLRPKVLMSAAAEFLLTPNELQSALRHELAHVRRRDNLKKLFLRFVVWPGMRRLETAWLETTEMAADDAAVSNSCEALDLAAALIKLSRLGMPELRAELTTALVHAPAASVNARVERLIAWSEQRKAPTPKYSSWYALGATLATVACFAVTYSALLVRVHTATEWLVR